MAVKMESKEEKEEQEQKVILKKTHLKLPFSMEHQNWTIKNIGSRVAAVGEQLVSE